MTQITRITPITRVKTDHADQGGSRGSQRSPIVQPAILALIVALFAVESTAQVVRAGDGLRDPLAEAKGTATIRGRVTSIGSGKPLRRAQIRLTPVEGTTPRTASTATDGRYEIRDLPAGRYTLRVERSGYLPLTYGQRRPGEQAKPFEIGDKEVAEKIDF